MEYITAHYMQGEGLFLVLQKYCYRTIPICVACIGIEPDRQKREKLTESLRIWTEHFPWRKLAAKPAAWKQEARMRLCSLIQDSSAEIVVCVKDDILLLRGSAPHFQTDRFLSAYVISGFFGQGHAKRLSGEFDGKIEPGAGILFADSDYLKQADEKILGQVLRLFGTVTEEKAQKHLSEVAHGADGLAILLIAREEEPAAGR